MTLPVQIVFRNIQKSKWIEELVQEKADKLTGGCTRITSFRVSIEMPHRHQHQGNLFLVRIAIIVPDKEIVVNHEDAGQHLHEDVGVALRDAFDSAKRQLEEYMSIRRHDVKSHLPVLHAHISQLKGEERYGFLETVDGRSIYFHANSLVNKEFGRLAVGQEVAFVEEEGVQGPQACTVKVINRALRRRPSTRVNSR